MWQARSKIEYLRCRVHRRDTTCPLKSQFTWETRWCTTVIQRYSKPSFLHCTWVYTCGRFQFIVIGQVRPINLHLRSVYFKRAWHWLLKIINILFMSKEPPMLVQQHAHLCWKKVSLQRRITSPDHAQKLWAWSSSSKGGSPTQASCPS